MEELFNNISSSIGTSMSASGDEYVINFGPQTFSRENIQAGKFNFIIAVSGIDLFAESRGDFGNEASMSVYMFVKSPSVTYVDFVDKANTVAEDILQKLLLSGFKTSGFALAFDGEANDWGDYGAWLTFNVEV